MKVRCTGALCEVESAAAFIDGLNETVPDVADRTELYRPDHSLKLIGAESTEMYGAG